MPRYIYRRDLVTGASALTLSAAASGASAQAGVTRIGVLTDMSGPFAIDTGHGSVAAARLAVEEASRAHPDLRVELIEGDFRGDRPTGIAMAREWVEQQGVAAIIDVPMSAVALEVAGLVRQHDRVALFSGPGTNDLTGSACGPNHIHWTYDTYALANGTARAIVADGGDTWFLITADYAFGHKLAEDTSRFVIAAGGSIVGERPTEFPGTTDFSEAIVEAAASGAKVVGLANAGRDTVACVRQAGAFGLTQGGQRLAGLLFQITAVHAVGLAAARGLTVTEAFYWDLNDRTRAFGSRFAAMMGGDRPNMVQAGVYSATLHYLKVLAATPSASGRVIVERMKAMPTDDDAFGPGTIREDGRKMHDMHVFQVKSPGESAYKWDYYRLRSTVPAATAFRPLAEGGCKMDPT